MPRKVYSESGMVTDGWLALDPADVGLIQGIYKKNIREGEERLMLAVLESAVEDFQRYVLARNISGRRLFQQAEEWFLDKDSEEPFSFGSVCETLGLNPEHIRKGLLIWKEARIKTSSLQGHPTVRPKLAKSRIMRFSARLSKTV
jgi:hypothetical protein